MDSLTHQCFSPSLSPYPFSLKISIFFLKKGEKLLDIGVGDNLVEMTPKAQATNVKSNEWDNVKHKSFSFC